ncbi:PREDICTED: serine carboxypeptidase-like 11 isoform X2 [Ipomoea nil]|uniref:serine carboxypeptidase-like 11 isoform X2 n=1 Tax=Ipomoea nil TaxID=35883 RepID=UPI0009015828|nr:PREDICTED: serine carboxypeptidase-like 11 isoform X2 [Ipomoea nil]
MKPSTKHSLSFNHFLFLATVAVVGFFPEHVISAGSKVDVLPGFEGPLPFHLETGYIGVGESEEIQLFYYFVKSETNPKDDPVILWISGERGCSSLTGLVYEIGPLFFEAKVYNGTLPTLLLSGHSLTKSASMIFLDQLPNIGFSYSTKTTTFTDVQASNYIYEFLQKWFDQNQDFVSNPFFIASSSDGGLIVPTIVEHISDGNEAAKKPINLEGYILGNPKTYPHEENFRVVFAYGMGFLTTEFFESLNESCENEYMNVDPENELCAQGLQKFYKLVDGVSDQHVLEANCGPEEPSPEASFGARRALDEQRIRSFNEKFLNLYGDDDDDDRIWCRVDYHRLSNYWANDPSVQNALHVRKVSSNKWTRCNWNTVSKIYKVTVQDTRLHHAILNAKGYRSLIYSGDHDMIVPFQSTQAWIRDLYYTIDHDWAPYFVNHEVGGYTRNFTSNMTYATVKGAGHIATEHKPDMCVGLISRWIAGKDISLLPFPVVTAALKQFMQSGKDKLSPFSQLQAEARDFPFILG